jgi:hypothetical protein
VRNQEIFDYFIDLAWLISQRPIEYNYSVGLTPIELIRCGNALTNQVETLIRSGQEAIQELLSNSSIHCLELH